MLTPSYAEIAALIALEDHRSFSAAARHLGISTSTLSGTIRKLEDKFAVRLVNRTTRSVALSEMGERVLLQFHRMLENYAALDETVKSSQGKVAGRIRIVAQPPAAQVFLGSAIARFSALYPEVSIDVVVTPRERVNLVGEEFDLGIGARRAINEDMVAVRVSDPIRTVITASPAYLAKHPTPQNPDDLKDHNCVRRCDSQGNALGWKLQKNGQPLLTKVHGSILTNDSGIILSAGLGGTCLIFTTFQEATPFIADGRLVTVMDDWTFEYDGYYLYYPTRRQLPFHIRAFIDFISRDQLFPTSRGLPGELLFQT